MDDDVETIKKMIIQQIKPINFGDELNIAAILGEEWNEDIPDDVNADPATPTQTISSPLKPVENIVCHVCSKIFANSRNFKKHFSKHTGRFSCPSCKKIFTRKETQLRHIPRCKCVVGKTEKRKRKTSQEEGNKFYCEKCCKSFTRRENYDQHIMVHNGVQVICNTCKKKLSSFKSFQRHRKLHENPQEKISCQDCPSKFSLKSNLQRHIRLYQHKNQIICNKCNVDVKTEKNLQKHQSQDIISICSLCSQVFCLESNLRSHLKKDHPNLWFKCKKCANTPFMTRVIVNLQEHVKKIHSIQLQSSDCFTEGWFILISN